MLVPPRLLSVIATVSAFACIPYGTMRLCMAETLRVQVSEATITVYDGEEVLLSYNKLSPSAPDGIAPIYQRSGFLHPVCTPAGQVVTAMFPFDHPHQQGIFSAWVKTEYAGRSIDFWNLAKGTGRVVHHRLVSTFQDRGKAGFEVDLIHRTDQQPSVDVLRERWKVTAHPTDGTYRCFDLHTTQSALTGIPLKVLKFHYGGMALRGPVKWLNNGDSDSNNRPDLVKEASGFLNNLGSKRVEGNHQHAKWVSLWGNIDGKTVSITVLVGKNSFRAPQAARLHPTKPYFCFCPCVDDEFVIDRDQPYEANYRYLVTDADPDPGWLDQQWESWTKQ